MFAKETYIQRRALLKKNIGSGVLLFLGNDEQGLHYEDNTFRYRQDSTFLYYFGLSFAGLSAIIDIDEDKEIIFGDELTIDHIVWMGTQPTLKEKSGRVGITEVMPSAEIMNYLHKAVRKGQTVHYLPPYRAEHKLKLMEWLGIPPARQEGSVPFIRAIVAQRSYKSAEEVEEIEKACNVTADMHITAMKVLRPGMYEYEVVAEMNRVAESNNCELSFATIATVNGQTLHNHYHGNKVKPGDLFLIEAGAEVYVTKPFNVKYLEKVVYRLIQRESDLKEYYSSIFSSFTVENGNCIHKEDQEFLDKVLETIEKNITNPDLSVELLSSDLGYSTRQFYRKLKPITEKSPADIIKEYRLTMAERLLLTKNLTIEEIMDRTGFNNRGTFYKLFSSRFGMPPRQYREQQKDSVKKELTD